MGITIFTAAPIPANDHIRSLAAIQSGLLSRVNDPVLREIASYGQQSLKARWCGVILMIDEVQHIIASSDGLIGLYRRSTTFSSYVIYDPSYVFVVLDAVNDPRFSGNPYVDEGLVGFYAGAAIFNHANLAIGAVCISNSTSRSSFTADEVDLLCDLSRSVTSTLE